MRRLLDALLDAAIDGLALGVKNSIARFSERKCAEQINPKKDEIKKDADQQTK